jgi:hypothetical protein
MFRLTTPELVPFTRPRLSRPRLGVAAVGVAAALAGCGSGTHSSTSSSRPPQAPSSSHQTAGLARRCRPVPAPLQLKPKLGPRRIATAFQDGKAVLTPSAALSTRTVKTRTPRRGFVAASGSEFVVVTYRLAVNSGDSVSTLGQVDRAFTLSANGTQFRSVAYSRLCAPATADGSTVATVQRGHAALTKVVYVIHGNPSHLLWVDGRTGIATAIPVR